MCVSVYCYFVCSSSEESNKSFVFTFEPFDLGVFCQVWVWVAWSSDCSWMDVRMCMLMFALFLLKSLSSSLHCWSDGSCRCMILGCCFFFSVFLQFRRTCMHFVCSFDGILFFFCLHFRLLNNFSLHFFFSAGYHQICIRIAATSVSIPGKGNPRGW